LGFDFENKEYSDYEQNSLYWGKRWGWYSDQVKDLKASKEIGEVGYLKQQNRYVLRYNLVDQDPFDLTISANTLKNNSKQTLKKIIQQRT
jgi:hypothetical protein